MGDQTIKEMNKNKDKIRTVFVSNSKSHEENRGPRELEGSSTLLSI